MVKKKSGNLGNKFASIGLIALGLLFFLGGLSVVGSGSQSETITFILIGLIMVVLGGILFKKSFLNK